MNKIIVVIVGTLNLLGVGVYSVDSDFIALANTFEEVYDFNRKIIKISKEVTYKLEGNTGAYNKRGNKLIPKEVRT